MKKGSAAFIKMNILKCDWNSLFWVLASRIIAFVVLFIFVFDMLFFPIPSIAGAQSSIQSNIALKARIVEKTEKQDREVAQTKYLPLNKDIKTQKAIRISLTAYTSSIEECQGDPCITANGFNLCRQDQEDTIATNRLPLGTKVKIPELYEDKVFVVRDRMNKRYYNRADIWMQEKEKAIQFGIKRNVKLIIVE